jgi:hypothetical protein
MSTVRRFTPIWGGELKARNGLWIACGTLPPAFEHNVTNLAKPLFAVYCPLKFAPPHWGSTMSNVAKIAFAVFIVALAGTSDPASARTRPFPLTRCGPDLAYLCRLHGSFEARPFHYNLAIYPGCIKVVPVETAYGIERRPVVVCGAPERPTVWWW